MTFSILLIALIIAAGFLLLRKSQVIEIDEESDGVSITGKVQLDQSEDDSFMDELDGGSEILRAVRTGNVSKVKGLVAKNSKLLEQKGHMGRRPLHIAVENNDLPMVRYLLESGANVDATRDNADTPLFWAPTSTIAQSLINAGASLHAKDFAGREPIHWAAQFARPDVIALFIEHGCNINIPDDGGHTPLHWATDACGFINICDMTNPKALNCVEFLIQNGADVNAKGLEGNVPLHGVMVMPNMEQRLFNGELKFPPEIPDTILSIVQLLLEAGADPTIANKEGVSPRNSADDEIRAKMEPYIE